MPTADTLAHLGADWAENFGCSVADLHRPGITQLRNAGDFAEYRGAYLLRWDEACVFTVPEPFYAATAAAITGRTIDEVFDRDFLTAHFGANAERFIGPTFRSCCDSGDFRPAETRGTRLLTREDDPALLRLRDAAGEEAWEHSSIVPDRPPNFGSFVDGELVCAGMLRTASSRLRNVGILTHPAYRRQGYGRAVVSFMTAYAVAEGGIGHYQTLMANTGSKAIALSLGYVQYATAYAVRLMLPAT
ncbi:MAG TPA: GNAT family N-acetyltransferase [Ktedonobacterales bacterium]